ncbi:MAG: Ku protein, partial [Actinomycetota bacterium]
RGRVVLVPTAVWTGTLSFGLVAIPVRLITATEPKDVRFHLYDRAGRRVRQQRVVEAPIEEDPAETRRAEVPAAEPSRPVAWDELMRGHETEEGDVVLVSHEEIEGVRPQRSRSIDIEDFVALADIDPVHFEKTYVAVPRSPEATRPYVLLHRAMSEAGRVGIGRFVLRTKPHLVAVRPMRNALAVETLFFGDELREPSALAPGLEGVEVDDRELELAVRLIEQLTTEWDPAAYADTYREELLRMLAEKTPTPRALEEPAASGRTPPVTELMAALKESVEASKKSRGKGRSRVQEG